MRKIISQILPDKKSWVVNEALIELGATVCGRKAKCFQCPLKESCQAFLTHQTERLPVKSKQVKTEILYRAVAVVVADEHVLIRRGLPGEIMNDLHEFPYLETDSNGLSPSDVAQKFFEKWRLDVSVKASLSLVKQSFTRYRVNLTPVILKGEQRSPIDGHIWYPLKDIGQLAFSSGHRRILAQLFNN